MNDIEAKSVSKSGVAPIRGGACASPVYPPEAMTFSLWSVFHCPPLGSVEPELAVSPQEVAEFLNRQYPGVQLRGVYDLTGMKAWGNLMIWCVGVGAQELQKALHGYQRSPVLRSGMVTWTGMGVHREAEFAKSHQPSFMLGLPPKKWLCVYPFVRSYDWYLLPEQERGRMLRDHGLKGRQFPQVQANTVSSFALGDWEWLLGLEADELIDLVDLMRHLRATDARMHVREEVPFHTGRLLGPEEISEILS